MPEIKRDELPPHLAALSDKDLEGVYKRAEREGVPVEQLKLRESDKPGDEMLAAEEREEKDALGRLARARRENVPFDHLPKRDMDDLVRLKRALTRVVRSAGFIVKSGGDKRVTGKLSAREVDRMIKEEKGRK